MYSCRLWQGERACRNVLEELGEVGAGELPVEGLGQEFVVGLEGEDPGGELVERGGVGWGQDLAGENAEGDLD